MTEVFQYGMDNPNDIQIENLQNFSDSEDENRDEEIKKAIAEFNETFDYDSDDCAASQSSSVNGTMFGNGNDLNLNMLPNTIVDGTPNPFNNFLKKKVTIVEPEPAQKNRDDGYDLHENYCPRNENKSHENREEQMKTFLEIRERQIHRGEEEINKLQKDKRSLNHQIGMMKTEMVQLKNHLMEGEKTVQLKEEECDYLKRRLREAIEEFESARTREIAAHDQISNLNVEIDKLREEVQLLSNIGSSVQQAEIGDVVRQLREKHAAENLSWKKQINELEGELRAIRQVDEDTINQNIVEKRPKETAQIAIIEDKAGGDLQIKRKEIVSLNEKLEKLKQDFEEEKMQMVGAFEAEVEQYRHRLASLPNELYQRWLTTHKELGLQGRSDTYSKPICVDAFTSAPDSDSIPSKTLSNDNAVQTDDTETQNAMVQTDETLQSYKVLEQLLGSWSLEVHQAKANEDEMTVRCREYEEELSKFRKQFKILQKVATKCRKESKRREEALKKQNQESKARYMEVLQKLDEKLEALS